MIHQISWIQDAQIDTLKLVWITDTHMDAASQIAQATFLDDLLAAKPDVILVGGDLCNGHACLQKLQVLQKMLQKPIFFVLGNHDFYYGSIAKIREMAQDLSTLDPNIKFLTDGSVIPLAKNTALIGHDGWSDGQAGNFLQSSIQLNDYVLIDELRSIAPEERLARLAAYGQEAAESLKKGLLAAFTRYQRVIILTHVPPFREVCLYEGQPTDDNWAPHFVGMQTGQMLLAVAKSHPDKEILVLCGHTHSSADLFMEPNLRIVVGESELGAPALQGIVLLN